MAIQRNCNPVLQVWKSLQYFKVTMTTFFETLLCTNYCIISFNLLSYVSYFLQRSKLGLRELKWLSPINRALDGKVKILSPFKFTEGFHWCTLPITSTWGDKTCMPYQIHNKLRKLWLNGSDRPRWRSSKNDIVAGRGGQTIGMGVILSWETFPVLTC